MHLRSTVVRALLASALVSACKRAPSQDSERSATPARALSAVDAGSNDVAPTQQDPRSDGSAEPLTADASTDPEPTDSEPTDAPSSSADYRTPGGAEFWFDRDLFARGPRRSSRRASPSPQAITARSGRAPSPRAFSGALATALRERATYTLQGGFNAIGDGRFVSVALQSLRDSPSEPWLIVASSSESDGAAQIEGTATIPSGGARNSLGMECSLSVRGRELRDFDHDGEPELALSVSYCTEPEPGTGHTTFELLAVVDLLPTPTIAAVVEREQRPMAIEFGRRAMRTRWRDTNADGSLDLVVEGEDCAWVRAERGADGPIPSAALAGCDRVEDNREAFPGGVLCCMRRTETAAHDAERDQWLPVLSTRHR